MSSEPEITTRTTDDAGPADVLPTRQGYDRWSAIYDDEDNPLIRLEEPVVDALIGDVRDLRVLDVGCGTGRWTFRLSSAGAEATGVDFSEGMLAKARVKKNADRIQFVQHDLAQPLPFPDGSFERVISCLVLEHIREMDLLFREMKRVCRPDGLIVISDMHPAMMLRGIQARFTDPETGRDTRPRSTEHQISDYVMGATRAGLVLDHLGEHVVDAALAARSPRAAKYLGWPMLLTLRLRLCHDG